MPFLFRKTLSLQDLLLVRWKLWLQVRMKVIRKSSIQVSVSLAEQTSKFWGFPEISWSPSIITHSTQLHPLSCFYLFLFRLELIFLPGRRWATANILPLHWRYVCLSILRCFPSYIPHQSVILSSCNLPPKDKYSESSNCLLSFFSISLVTESTISQIL